MIHDNCNYILNRKELIMDKEMQKYLEKAQVLIEALPYIQKYILKIWSKEIILKEKIF